jgi:hypothetical protein
MTKGNLYKAVGGHRPTFDKVFLAMSAAGAITVRQGGPNKLTQFVSLTYGTQEPLAVELAA